MLAIRFAVASLATLICSAWAVTARSAPSDSPPAGVQILLPRGAIPAVFEPTFVAAAESGLPDSAWVLGVTVGGESHGHEVVNDVLAKRPIAAVW